MLEHVPAWLGQLLANARAGHEKLTTARLELDPGLSQLNLVSTAFAHGARLPDRFTADGDGVSPPLTWNNPPAGTRAFALIVEDPDAPAPRPLVHALAWGIDADARRLEEGALAGEGDETVEVGRNSYLAAGWLPPDPPTGHGPHDYVFQLFALDERADLGRHPGRSQLAEALDGHVLAVGILVGTYERLKPDAVAEGAVATEG